MSEHVCSSKEDIKRLERENEFLKGEVAMLKDTNGNMKIDLAEFKVDMKYTKETLGDIKIIVERLADEPRKSWDAVKRQALAFIVGGGLIGFLLWSGYMVQSFKK